MTTTTAAGKRTWWQFAGYLAQRATLMELRGYQSIYRFVFRRPRVPGGATAFTYHQPILAILIVIVVVSAVEMVVVDVIVQRWAYVRIPLLILSAWGLVYMLGLLFGMLVRPHAVGPEGINVRSGSEIDIPLPWCRIDSVTRRKLVNQDKQPKVTVSADGRATLQLRIQNETNIEIALERPTTVKLPQGTEVVDAVALYADDPKAFMDAVRTYL